jgi:murein DD-endopeptidase MepM/ murein hydrolase activator NlpD
MRGNARSLPGWALPCATVLAAIALSGCASTHYAPVVYHDVGQMSPSADAQRTARRSVPWDDRNPWGHQSAQTASARKEVRRDPSLRTASVGRVQSETLASPESVSSLPPPQSSQSYASRRPVTGRPARLIISQAQQPAPAPPPVAAQTIIVRPGDTVYSLARNHGIDRKEIIAANHLQAPYMLKAGQRLRLPGTAMDAASLKSLPGSTSPYTVASGETLYSIARKKGVTVYELAYINGIAPPFDLKVGEHLKIPNHGAAASRIAHAGPRAAAESEGGPLLAIGQRPMPPASAPEPKERTASLKRRAGVEHHSTFIWPVRGRVISDYGVKGAGRRNDGINIAVPPGSPVHASRAGEVIYAGNGLRGYGNLVLIRHDDGFVSAYAHNSHLLVKRGDFVQQGQVIADSGESGGVTRPQVHFEIRKNRQPVDPESFLPST